MTIREQILEDIKTAMKEKDNFRRDTLRLINSVIKQVEVDGRRRYGGTFCTGFG
mgnify:CR=1 FL=1